MNHDVSTTPASLIIIGAGDFGSEAAWVAEAMGDCWRLLGFADADASRAGSFIGTTPVLGTLMDVQSRFKHESLWYICAIGNNVARERMTEHAESLGWNAATLIHPSAVIAPTAMIGAGTYIGALVVVCPQSKIGSHAIINVRASIGHDVAIADFAQICPGASISGRCVVGRSALIGSNATLLPGVTVGCGAVAGANSHVGSNLEADVTAIGVPARVILKKPSISIAPLHNGGLP